MLLVRATLALMAMLLSAEGLEVGPLQPALEARDPGRVGKYFHRDRGSGEGSLDGPLVVLSDVLPVAAQGAHRARDKVYGMASALLTCRMPSRSDR